MSDNENRDYGIRKAVINKPLAWQDLNLSEQVKGLRFFRDSDNNIIVFATMGFDATQTGLGVLPMTRMGIADPTAYNSYARVYGNVFNGYVDSTLGLVTQSTLMLDSPTEGKLRPVERAEVAAYGNKSAAGDTDLLGASVGRRYVILGMSLCISGGSTLAAAGINTIQIKDDTAVIWQGSAYILNAVPSVPQYWMLPLPLGGFRCAAPNKAVKINIATAFALGGVDYAIYYTWEAT